ncbi:SipW-dependent-type signal peptide-containing protein [Microbacterium xylanilyticum]
MRASGGRRAARPAGERSIRLLRIRALLAGGLVLGTGATSTLASWNDAEYANGTFTAARFGIEGSLDGTNYAKHTSTSAAALSFSPAVTGLFRAARRTPRSPCERRAARSRCTSWSPRERRAAACRTSDTA